MQERGAVGRVISKGIAGLGGLAESDNVVSRVRWRGDLYGGGQGGEGIDFNLGE